jgi:hypothetical protein
MPGGATGFCCNRRHRGLVLELRVDPGSSEQVEIEQRLGQETIPQMKRKVFVGAAEASYEMVFECLNGSFCYISPVDMWGSQLKIYALLLHKVLISDSQRRARRKLATIFGDINSHPTMTLAMPPAEVPRVAPPAAKPAAPVPRVPEEPETITYESQTGNMGKWRCTKKKANKQAPTMTPVTAPPAPMTTPANSPANTQASEPPSSHIHYVPPPQPSTTSPQILTRPEPTYQQSHSPLLCTSSSIDQTTPPSDSTL